MKRDNINAYVHIRRDNPSSYTQLYAFWMTPLQLRTYLIDGPFLNQKHIKTFEYRIHWNINVRKNKFLSKKVNSSINKKNNNTMSVMLCTGVTFVKKNSCLVARIVSFDTAGLHLLTFRILDPCTSKDIELDFSHVISH